jgi:hypothetical protein
MPSVTRLGRLVRLATLPETRGLVVAAAHSETLRDIGQRAVHDRAALVRIWAILRTLEIWFAAPPDTQPPVSLRVPVSCFCQFDIYQWVGRRHG